MAKQKDIRPFFDARNEFLPSLERFVNAAHNLYNACDILTGQDGNFPGKDILRKRVEEMRATMFSEDDQ